MNEPRILLWDIETGYNIMTLFGLFNGNYLPPQAIIQERYMICSAFKLLGKKRVSAISVLDDPARFAKDPSDDYHVVKAMHKVLCGVDAVIAHNGDKFDTKFFNGRALFHGLPPVPPIKQIDTLKIAKRYFKLNSNRLDYIGQYLGLGRKIKTDASLWLGCLQGRKSAVRNMVKYNRQDVNLLESVYMKLRPYDDLGLNQNLFHTSSDHVCPKCGSFQLVKQGTRKAITRVYQQYQCKNCGGWSRSIKCDRTKSVSVR